jgi:hypothetical protein
MSITGIQSAFTVRAQLHNSALPAANTNLISDITGPSTVGQGAVKFVIYACSTIAGALNLRRTRSAVTVTETIGTLVANTALTAEVYVDQGETINLQTVATGGTMLKLMVVEKPF